MVKLRNLAILMTAVLAICVVVVLLQSSELRVSRSVTIEAPAGTVFEQVNDFHKWQGWSPWEKVDPQMTRTYEGPAQGTGASYVWSGNDQAGEGRMTITESKPNELIRIRLDFVRPMPSTNELEFTFQPKGNATEATWTLTGRKNFLMKALSPFMSIDNILGSEFEKGLEAMKKIAEGKS